MAIRPDPAYVLTSSTSTFSGNVNATYNSYVMPVGYGVAISGHSSGTITGSGSTRYEYTDLNASERLGNSIASAISRSKKEAYRKRGLEVVQEYETRVWERRLHTEHIIKRFFAQNPQLESRRALIAAVAPWAAAEGNSDSYGILERSKQILSSLPIGEGLSGRWYGTVAQTSTISNGEVVAFNEFVRLDLEQQGEQIRGKGILGTGEIIEFTGDASEGQMNGIVANTTSGINARLTGLAAPNQITGSFTGSGTGVTMEGTFTLLR